MNSENVQAAIKELQDAMVVIAHMETRQTERLLRHEAEMEEFKAASATQRVQRVDFVTLLEISCG